MFVPKHTIRYGNTGLFSMFILSLCLAAQMLQADTPVGSAFSYQGRIKQNGVLVSGFCDFKFTLWNHATASAPANQVGGMLTFEIATAINVEKGLFNANLDFGAGAFDGNARWLQIAIRYPSGPGIFVTVSPRQALTAEPFSLSSAAVNSRISSGEAFVDLNPVPADGVSLAFVQMFRRTNTVGNRRVVLYRGDGTNAIDSQIGLNGDHSFFQALGGSFGVGTSSPQTNFHIKKSGDAECRVESGNNAYLTLDSGNGWNSNILFRTAGVDDWRIAKDALGNLVYLDENNVTAMTLTQGGNVGIGWPAPIAALHVDGPNVNASGDACLRIGTDSTAILFDSNEITTANDATLYVQTGKNGNLVLCPEVGSRCGIGTQTMTFELNAGASAGKPGGGSWSDLSDVRLKQNIQPLESSLDRLLQLRGVTYEWIEPAKHGNLTGTQIGMIAQDVEPHFPQWVGEDDQGFKTLGFTGFEALTVEALRDLRNEKDDQLAQRDQKIAELQTTISDLSARLEALEAQMKKGRPGS